MRAAPLTPALIQALQAAHGQFARGDLAGADRALRALRASQGDQPDVLHLHALVQRQAGDLAAARDSLQRAVRTGPNAERYNTLGNIAVAAGDAAGGREAFARALRLDPNYAPALINMALAEVAARRFDRALASAERAAQLQPGSVLALTTLARVQRESGRHEAAIATARRAAALEPGGGGAQVHLGLALAAAGQPAAALAAYDAAAGRGYAEPELDENRVAALLDTGAVEAARVAADALVARRPDHLPGHRLRARLYWEYGLEGDAFAPLRERAKRDRTGAGWLPLVALLLDFKDYPAVRATLADAARAGVEHPMLRFADAVAAGELRDDAAADRLFDALAPQLGEADEFQTAHARHLLRRRDPARAEQAAATVVGRSPHHQLAWAYRGTAWRLLGDARADWLHDYDMMVALEVALPPGEEDAAAFVARSAAALRALHRTRVHPADQSLRNGTQTPGALFDRPEPAIRAIRDAALAAATRVAARLPRVAGHPFLGRGSRQLSFAGSWSVRLTRAGFHINHVHQAGWLSSAFYFALPAAATGDDPHAGYLQLGAPPADLGLDLPPLRIVRPVEGMLALFPSSMWHGTLPFTTDGERLTAAFDIIPD